MQRSCRALIRNRTGWSWHRPETANSNSTLKSTSQFEALRASAPVDPFGLIARAEAIWIALKTVLESFGYYQSSGLDHDQRAGAR